MDFRATIDLVKYTLALCAACFVYTLEKLTPAPSEAGRWFVLALLVAFILSSLGGLVVFSSATAALHGDAARADRQKKIIEWAGYVHLGFLGLGIVSLGSKLVITVLTEAPAPLLSSQLWCRLI